MKESRSEERGRKEKDNYDNDIPCTCPLLFCIIIHRYGIAG